MAGTRRGAERKAESDAFEAANPFLGAIKTKLEVELVDADELGFGPGTEYFQWGYESSEYYDWDGEDIPDIPVPLVTQDGAEVESFTDDLEEWPGFSTAYRIYTPVGDLDSDTRSDEDSEISMSAYGFGVLSEDEESDLYDVLMDEDPDMGAFALNGDEILEFDIDLPRRRLERDLEEEEEGPVQGGIGMEIEYLVLGGTGQVGLYIEEGYDGEWVEGFDPENRVEVQVLSDLLSEGDTGTLTAAITGGKFFEDGEIFVEGGLEVAIVGITVVTNFEGELGNTF